MTRPDTDSLEDRLVSAAYIVAVEPHRFLELESVVNDILDRVELDGSALDPDAIQLVPENLAAHIETAQSLLDRQGARTPAALPGRAALEASARPSLQVTREGRIAFANAAAVSAFGVAEGAKLADYIDDRSERETIATHLDDLASMPLGQVAHTFRLSRTEDGRDVSCVLIRSEDTQGCEIAYVTTLLMDWNAAIGRAFQQRFALTDTELELTRAVVQSRSLRDVADERGRSLGTVRNQLKHLFAKLGIHSQNQLGGLYSGFAQVMRIPTLTGEAPDGMADGIPVPHANVARPGRDPLPYSVFGPASGHPVLLFSSPFIGGYLTRAARAAILRHRLRVIVPTIPGHSGTPFYGKHTTIVRDFCEDVVRILDKERVATSVALGSNGRSPFAFGMAARFGERTTAVVGATPALPFIDPLQYAGMNASMRAIHLLARHSPSLMGYLLRAGLATMNAGYDEEYARKLYQGSAADMASLETPEHRHALRWSLEQNFKLGSRAPTEHFKLLATDWTDLVDATTCPVHIVTGADNTVFVPQGAILFAETRHDWTVDVVPDAGMFIMLQRPEPVFDAVARYTVHS